MSNLKSQNHNSNLKSNDLKLRAYKFSLTTITFTNLLPNKRAFWSIADQLLRSATSIGANIIEAKSSSSKENLSNITRSLLSQQMKQNIGYAF